MELERIQKGIKRLYDRYSRNREVLRKMILYTEEQLLPIDEDGLFPGQLKPHIVPVTDNYDNPEPMAPDPGCKT